MCNFKIYINQKGIKVTDEHDIGEKKEKNNYISYCFKYEKDSL